MDKGVVRITTEKELKKMFGGRLSRREREKFLGKSVKKKPKSKNKRISVAEFMAEMKAKRKRVGVGKGVEK